MKSRFAIVPFALVVLLVPRQTVAQNSAADLVAIGLRQLDIARGAHSDGSYQEAEDTLTKALAQDPDNAQALVHRGEIRIARGTLAVRTAMGPAIELFQSGMADMDRAVSLAPGQLDVRLTRGLAYVAFPTYYNKGDTAREDLGAAVSHAQFGSLPQNLRDRALQALERIKTSAASSGTAVNRRDRFPNVSSDTSPIVAAASVTFPDTRAGATPEWLAYLMKGLDGVHGLLGTHTVASVDHPGMFIIFTWWTNKQALDDFYYSDTHQGWMRGRGDGVTGVRTVSPQEIPSQVGIEIFAGLPGGVTLNGGFVPLEVLKK